MFFLRRHIVAVFFALAFLISWGCWIWAALSRQPLSGFVALIAGIGTFGPAIAGFVCTWAAGGRDGVRQLLGRMVAWRVSWKAYLFAILMPFLLAFLPLFLLAFVRGPTPEYEGLVRLPALLPAFLGAIFLGGLTEEPGWRGFALPILRQRQGRVGASLLIGIFWGVWHIPLFTLGTGIPGASLIGFMILTMIISILFTALADLAQDSVLLAIFFHAAYNTFLPHLPALLKVPNATQHQMIAVLLVVAMVFGVLWWWRRQARR